MVVNLSTSQFLQPPAIGSTASDGVRQVLAVVDLNFPISTAGRNGSPMTSGTWRGGDA